MIAADDDRLFGFGARNGYIIETRGFGPSQDPHGRQRILDLPRPGITVILGRSTFGLSELSIMRRQLGHERMSVIGVSPPGRKHEIGVVLGDNVKSPVGIVRTRGNVLLAPAFPFHQDNVEILHQGSFTAFPHLTTPGGQKCLVLIRWSS